MGVKLHLEVEKLLRKKKIIFRLVLCGRTKLGISSCADKSTLKREVTRQNLINSQCTFENSIANWQVKRKSITYASHAYVDRQGTKLQGR